MILGEAIHAQTASQKNADQLQSLIAWQVQPPDERQRYSQCRKVGDDVKDSVDDGGRIDGNASRMD